MDIKLIKTDGKKTAAELFEIESNGMKVSVVEYGDTYATQFSGEIPKGEYIAMTDAIDWKAYDYCVHIFFGQDMQYQIAYYLYEKNDLLNSIKKRRV